MEPHFFTDCFAIPFKTSFDYDTFSPIKWTSVSMLSDKAFDCVESSVPESTTHTDFAEEIMELFPGDETAEKLWPATLSQCSTMGQNVDTNISVPSVKSDHPVALQRAVLMSHESEWKKLDDHLRISSEMVRSAMDADFNKPTTEEVASVIPTENRMMRENMTGDEYDASRFAFPSLPSVLHASWTGRSVGRLLVPEDDFENRMSTLLKMSMKVPKRRKRKRSGVIDDFPGKPRISEESMEILHQWLHDHFLDPYPDNEEKQELSAATGLSISQIQNWFVNNRKRKWMPVYKQLVDEHIIESSEEAQEKFKKFVTSTVDKNPSEGLSDKESGTVAQNED